MKLIFGTALKLLNKTAGIKLFLADRPTLQAWMRVPGLCSKLPTFFYLRGYDTRTNQGYEGSGYRPGEVSLTSQTDDIKSMMRNSSR